MNNTQLHILLVEDDDDHVELIRRAFHSYSRNIRLTIAQTLEEGREQLANNRFDLTIADLVLPDGRGIELVKQENQYPSFPLIISTGQGDEEAAVEAMKAGALDYVVKSEQALKEMPHITRRVLREWEHITARKKLEQELIKKEKLQSIGTLAGGIAHDFNNLLSIIMGNVAMVKNELTPHTSQYRMLHNAEQTCKQAAVLARKLITFSNGGWAHKEEIDFSQILDKATELLPEEVMVEYCTDIAPDLPLIEGDLEQLGSVMANLLQNAAESMSRDEEVFIAAEKNHLAEPNLMNLPKGDYVKIYVIDKGRGISPENLEKVFDPYFSTKEMGPTKGMGLGLSICHSIIERHAGYISIDSEVGRGTTVCIYLPVVQ